MPKLNLFGESVDTSEWNPLIVSIYYGQLNLVRFFMENINEVEADNIRFSLTADCQWVMPTLDCLCFSMTLCINKRHSAILNYLINQYYRNEEDHYLIWNIEHLMFGLRGCIVEGWQQGIEIIMAGDALKFLYQSLPYTLRLDFLVDRIAPLIDLADEFLRKSTIFSILADYPYSCQALRFLLKEEEIDSFLLEKCVKNISSVQFSEWFNHSSHEIPETIENLKDIVSTKLL